MSGRIRSMSIQGFDKVDRYLFPIEVYYSYDIIRLNAYRKEPLARFN